MGRSIALIVESHGDFEKALFLQRRLKRQAPYSGLMGAAARVALRDADALRAISSATREQLSRLGATQPIVEFPTWSDSDVFLEAGQQRRQIGEDVLYAGVVTPLKGVHHLIAAFAAVPNRDPRTRLIVAGRCPDAAYRGDLDRQIDALRLGGAVTFVGEMPQKDLAARMASSRALVLPSYSEGLGRVLFEAMAVGTPVIGSEVGGIPDLIEDGVNGFLVAPGDEAELAARLTQILADDDLCTRLGMAGRARAEASLSTERYFAEYRRLFEIARERAGS
jgi:glycosyltransferase involved in cell wall biosynthesis